MEVKICGLTNIEDARAARDAGADYLGFVLYEKSPRAVTAEKLAGITAELGGGVRAIGVFVNEPAESVADVVEKCGLYGAQVHGDEPPESFSDLPFPIWRAVWIKEGIAVPDPEIWKADRYVIDAAVPGQYGGSGVTADWGAAAEISQNFPVMLAGGLTPGNVGDAVRAVRPLGVDVSGGVESVPGRKDHDALIEFVREAKAC
jgi:phosphoribosylanthranilate isomerase